MTLYIKHKLVQVQNRWLPPYLTFAFVCCFKMCVLPFNYYVIRIILYSLRLRRRCILLLALIIVPICAQFFSCNVNTNLLQDVNSRLAYNLWLHIWHNFRSSINNDEIRVASKIRVIADDRMSFDTKAVLKNVHTTTTNITDLCRI